MTNNYSTTSLNIIESSSILDSNDFIKLQDIKDELIHVFEKVQIFRTPTEMRISVLDDIKHPTSDSKYWQAIREQNVMFQELIMLSYEYRKNIVEIKKLEYDMSNESDYFEQELLQIEIEKKKFISVIQERTAKARINEILEWHIIKEELTPHLEAGIDDVNKHQLISYTIAWINQAKMMGNGGSQPERANLLGKLRTAILRCIDLGVLDIVLNNFTDDVQQQICKEYSSYIESIILE